jgi:hypothetical protein
MSHSIIYLGLDVHKDSITIAVLPEGAPAPSRVERLPNDLTKLRRFCERLAAEGALRACYEASGLVHKLQSAPTGASRRGSSGHSQVKVTGSGGSNGQPPEGVKRV